MGVVRSQAHGNGEVVYRLWKALQLGEGMTAMVVSLDVDGCRQNPSRVFRSDRLRGLGEMFDLPGQRAEIDLMRRQWGDSRDRLFIGWRIPVESHRNQSAANATQVPDMDGWLLRMVSANLDPSGLNAA
jgi:hypothetical protein